MDEAELYLYAKELSAPFELLKQVAKAGRLPVVMFSAGGIATPADCAVSLFATSPPYTPYFSHTFLFPFLVNDAVRL